PAGSAVEYWNSARGERKPEVIGRSSAVTDGRRQAIACLPLEVVSPAPHAASIRDLAGGAKAHGELRGLLEPHGRGDRRGREVRLSVAQDVVGPAAPALDRRPGDGAGRRTRGGKGRD